MTARLIDPVMALAVGGCLGQFAAAWVYCGTISTCSSTVDVARAWEWTNEVGRCGLAGSSDLPGDCRMHRAELLRIRGDWAKAELEMASVCDDLGTWGTGHLATAHHELGELSLRRGDLTAAPGVWTRLPGSRRWAREATSSSAARPWSVRRSPIGRGRHERWRSGDCPARCRWPIWRTEGSDRCAGRAGARAATTKGDQAELAELVPGGRRAPPRWHRGHPVTERAHRRLSRRDGGGPTVPRSAARASGRRRRWPPSCRRWRS